MLKVGLTPKSAGSPSLYALSFIFSNTLKGPSTRGISFDLRKLGVTPTMRLYLPRVRARLRGITTWWFCRKKGHLHTIPCNEQEWDKELAYNRHFTQYIT